MPDMHSNCVVCSDRLFIPDRLIDLVYRKYSPLVLHEQEQDVVLNGSQFHRLTVHGHFLQVVIDPKTSHFIDLVLPVLHRSAELRIPAQLRLHPRHQFQRIERLRHVIVRTDIESQYLVRILGLCRKDDDGNAVLLPDLKGGSDPVQLRHHDVNDQQVHVLLLKDADGLDPVIRLQDMVSLLAEIYLYRVYDLSIVVTY